MAGRQRHQCVTLRIGLSCQLHEHCCLTRHGLICECVIGPRTPSRPPPLLNNLLILTAIKVDCMQLRRCITRLDNYAIQIPLRNKKHCHLTSATVYHQV